MSKHFGKGNDFFIIFAKMKAQKRHTRKETSRFSTPKRYRLSLYNENSLNRIWSITMSRRRSIVLIVMALAVAVAAGMMLISFTPLRTYLPGYLGSEQRARLSHVDERIDSMSRRIAVNSRYIDNVSSILNGEIEPDSLLSEAVTLPADSVALIDRSKEEIEYVRMYKEREGFSLDDAQPLLAEAPLFVPPVRNAMVRVEGNAASPVFEFSGNVAEVYAVNRGTVIDQYQAPDGRYNVIIQHPDGYLSRYAGLSRIYSRAGAEVDADSHIGRYDVDASRPFGFGLSRDGLALHPLDYIPF